MKKKLPRVNRIKSYISNFYDEYSVILDYQNKIYKKSIKNPESFNVSHYIKSGKKHLNTANLFLFRNRKKKVDVVDLNNMPIVFSEVEVYLNSSIHRLWDLLYSILSLYNDSMYLASFMIERMCYENIAHTRFFLDSLKKSMTKKNEQEYCDLVIKYIYSQEIIDENLQYSVTNSNKLKRLPHINDSLRYYKTIKKEFLKSNTEEYFHRVDNYYKILSQISHPNARGNTYFYAKPDEKTFFEDDNFVWKGSSQDKHRAKLYKSYKFSHSLENTKSDYFQITDIIFKQLVDHCYYLKKFNEDFPLLKKYFHDYLKTKTDDTVSNYLLKFRKKSVKKYGLEPEETIH